MVFSNLFASKKRLVLDGKKLTGCFYYVPCPGQLCVGVSVIVVQDLIGLAVFSDENGITNPQELVDYFLDVYNKEIIENLT